MKKNTDSRKIGREAGTGRFIPVKDAERRKKNRSGGNHQKKEVAATRIEEWGYSLPAIQKILAKN